MIFFVEVITLLETELLTKDNNFIQIIMQSGRLQSTFLKTVAIVREDCFPLPDDEIPSGSASVFGAFFLKIWMRHVVDDKIYSNKNKVRLIQKDWLLERLQ